MKQDSVKSFLYEIVMHRSYCAITPGETRHSGIVNKPSDNDAPLHPGRKTTSANVCASKRASSVRAGV